MKMNSAVADSLRDEANQLEKRLAELGQQMDAIVDEQQEVSADLEAIKRILGRLNGHLGTAPEFELRPNGGANSDLSDLGFRDAMRAILAQAKSGMKPKDVRVALERGAWRPPSDTTTDLSVRVPNELYRMAKQGHLRRRAGKYFLPPADENVS